MVPSSAATVSVGASVAASVGASVATVVGVASVVSGCVSAVDAPHPVRNRDMQIRKAIDFFHSGYLFP